MARGIVLSLVGLCAAVVVGLVLVQQEPRGSDDTTASDVASARTACAPAPKRAAGRAQQRFLETYATDRSNAIQGAFLETQDGGFMIMVFRTRATPALPECFAGVPVGYLEGGPFKGN